MHKVLLTLVLSLGSLTDSNAENILDAENAIKNGAPLAAYQHLAPHPLYPYLQARAYRDDPATPVETIVAFLKQYPADPFSTQLAKQKFPLWLASGNNDAIIAAYSADYADAGIECDYRLAQLNKNHTRAATQKLDELWEQDKNLDAECNTLFDRLAHSGHISETQTAARFRQAMEQNNRLIASYLAGALHGAAAQAAQTWLRPTCRWMPPTTLPPTGAAPCSHNNSANA